MNPPTPARRTVRRPRQSLNAPQGRDSSIHNTPPTVTTAPACRGAKCSDRAIGSIRDANAVMAMAQVMPAAISGLMLKRAALTKGSPPTVTEFALS